MNPLAVGVAVAITISTLGLARLFVEQARTHHTFVSFGRPTGADHPDASRVLFLEYARQQRWAFALLWFTLAIAVVLTTALLLRAISGPAAGLAAIREMAGLTLDGVLAGGAARLYRAASRRLEKAVKEVGR